MEDSGNYEQYLINILKNGDHRTRSMAADLNIKPVIVDFDFVDPSKLPDITTTLTHYGDVYYIPIYDENKIITNKTLVVNAFYYLISNKSTKNNRDYLNNFNNVYGAMASDKPNLYYLLDNNLNLINNVINDTPIKVRGVIYNNEDLDLPSSYVNGYYDPSLYNPNDPSTRPIIVDNDDPIKIKDVEYDEKEHQYNDPDKLDNFDYSESDGSYVTRLLKIQKNKLNVQFTNCEVTRPANENDKFIYPVYDKFNDGKLNTYISKVTPFKTQMAKFRLAAKRTDIGQGFEYCYYIMGNVNASKTADKKQILPPSEISVFEFEIYKFTNEPPNLDDIFKKFIQRIDDLGYDLRNRSGPQILPKLWAANALNVHFTNYNCIDLPSENDEFIYPVLDLLTYGIEDYKKGWGKFADNLYYPYNYDVERVACKIVNMKNLYSPQNGFTTYKVEGIGKDNLLFGDEVARDPISAPITDLKFNESKRDLRTAQNAKFDGSTKRTVYIELLAVGAFSLVVGGVTIYISRDVLTTALMMAGVIVIGGISIVILNWNDISKKIKPIRETAGLVKYVL